MPDTPRSTRAPLTPPAVQLRLLGHFELSVHRESRTAHLTYDKPRILLAILALAKGEPISRARLADMLWPDISETQGKARIRHALHVLRQALAPHMQALVVHADRLALDSNHLQVDINSVLLNGPDALDDEMCLALYRGPLLDDLQSRSDGPLGEWLQHWKRQLDARLDQCRERLAANWLARNRLRDALNHAQRWVALWPTEESCHRILIDVLARSGSYEQARQAYVRCEEMLTSTAGAVPDARTQALIADLPLPHALQRAADADQDVSRYRPLAALAISISWRIEAASGLRQHEVLSNLDELCLNVRRCIQLHGGWLAPAGANLFIAYFGFPAYSERPVLRAAALAQALRQLPVPAVLALGMGLHADIGLCESGVRPDNGAFLAQTAVGLAMQARRGETLVSAQAARRMDEHDLQETRRHGRVCLALGHSRAMEVSRMHGRATEFAQLVQAWRRAATRSATETLVITGAAGTGKSLLAAGLAQHAQQTDADVVWLQCLQDQHSVPLHPLQQWLVAKFPNNAGALTESVLGSALGLPSDTCRSLATLLLPGMQANHASGADLLEAASRALNNPDSFDRALLIVVEDIHWADNVTRDWLEMLAMRSAGRPAMLLTTTRAGHECRSTDSTLNLAHLDKDTATEMVTNRSRALKLEKSVRALIAHHGRGNPLFITVMLAEAAARGSVERPARLVDMLCAQLATLDPVSRKLAQLAALYGAPLSSIAAAQILRCSPQALSYSHTQLLRAGILSDLSEQLWHSPTLISNIVQDLIDPDQREQLCREIAQFLIEGEHAHARVAPFLQQARDERAPVWWKGAAADALTGGHLRDAAALLAKALNASDIIDDASVRERFVFECQMMRGTLATALTGPAHPDAAASFGSAAALSPAGDLQTMVVTLWGQWLVAQNSGAHTEALRLAQQLMHFASSIQNTNFQGWASYALAQHYLWRGLGRDAQTLLAYAEQALSDTTEPADTPYGTHSTALIPASLAVAHALQGDFIQAHSAVDRSEALGAAGNAWMTPLLCRLARARVHYLEGDLEQARLQGELIVQHSVGADALTPWRAIAMGYAMLPLVLEGQNPEALLAMEAALPIIRQGMPVSVDGHLCLLARARIAMGDPQGAMSLLDEAHALGTAHGSSSLVAEIHCLRGDAWARLGEAETARAHWRHARAQAQALEQASYVHWVDGRLRAPITHKRSTDATTA